MPDFAKFSDGDLCCRSSSALRLKLENVGRWWMAPYTAQQIFPGGAARENLEFTVDDSLQPRLIGCRRRIFLLTLGFLGGVPLV